jgi:acetyl-CoA C-acetyltransferase
MVHDGLWCPFEQHQMGLAGETIAEEYGISREEQDAYAAESHRRAAAATAAGNFDAEITSVEITPRKGPVQRVRHDESIRPDTTVEGLARLAPAFRADGSVTAGNAPPVSDGAAALVVMSAPRATALGLTPMARIVAQATSGLAPRYLLMTPVEAVRAVARKAGWSIGDIDLVELNEAFSVQAVAVIRELGIDPARVNVHGGAVALGHPIGASGARILTTLLYALRARGLRRGVATLCLGGGNGVALAVESL